MGISNPHYELLAVTGGHVGPVTGVVHVPLAGGVQALYGRNGAGKTQVLRIVESAVTGVADRHLPEKFRGIFPHHDGLPFAHLHLRLIDVREREVKRSPLLNALTEAAKKAAQEMFGRRAEETRKDADPHDAFEHGEPKTVTEYVQNLLAQTFPTEDDDEIASRLIDIARQGRLTLEAVGTHTEPRWRVWLAYLPPAAEITSVREMANSPDETDESAADEYGRSPSPVAPILGPRPRSALDAHKSYDGGERAVLDYLALDGGDSPPEWAQLPVFDLGIEIDVQAADVVGGMDDRWTEGRATLRIAADHVRRETRNPTRMLTDDHGDLDASIRAEIERVEERTNDTLRRIFEPAPQLSFDVGGPSKWVQGDVPRWVHQPTGTTTPLPLVEVLSAAELRWAKISLGVAEMRFSDRPTIVLCDEPELELHLSAERRLPDALAYIAQRDEVAVLVATHSQYTLIGPRVSVVRVDRTAERGTSLDPHNTISLVDSTSRRRSEQELNLTPAELQSLMKVAVVVEGLHDEVVFSHLLRKELDAAVAGIFPLRGGAKAPTLLEAKLLIDGSDVPIVVVLDNTVQEQIEPIWNEIVRLAEAGDKDEARALADEKLKGVDELTYLRELARAGIESDVLGRVHFFGVRRPDVICYLPEDLILNRHRPTADWGWERFIEEFHKDEQSRQEQQGKKFQARSVKKFLSSNPSKSDPWFPAQFDVVNKVIQDVAVETARTGRDRHDELNELAAKILELS